MKAARVLAGAGDPPPGGCFGEIEDASRGTWTETVGVQDLSDREAGGHPARVAQIAVSLAQAMVVPDDQLAHIRRGALLHDIGKMGIPDGILFQPGALNDDEWRVMNLHPTYAYETLRPIELLRPELDIPFRHHER